MTEQFALSIQENCAKERQSAIKVLLYYFILLFFFTILFLLSTILCMFYVYFKCIYTKLYLLLYFYIYTIFPPILFSIHDSTFKR